MSSGSIKQVVDKISNYNSLINYFLIYPSGNNGLEFDLNFSSEFYQMLKEKLSRVVVGFVGGLNGENVYFEVNFLERKLGALDFLIDLKGRLRGKLFPTYEDGLLILIKFSGYISESSGVLK